MWYSGLYNNMVCIAIFPHRVRRSSTSYHQQTRALRCMRTGSCPLIRARCSLETSSPSATSVTCRQGTPSSYHQVCMCMCVCVCMCVYVYVYVCMYVYVCGMCVHVHMFMFVYSNLVPPPPSSPLSRCATDGYPQTLLLELHTSIMGYHFVELIPGD